MRSSMEAAEAAAAHRRSIKKRNVLPRRKQRSQMARPFRRPELAEGFGFNLANTFARYVELLPDLFQSMFALAADTEPQANHLLFFRREGFENIRGLIPHVSVDHRIHG